MVALQAHCLSCLNKNGGEDAACYFKEKDFGKICCY